SDGLVIYKAMKNLTANWETSGGITIPQTAVSARQPPPQPLRLAKLDKHMRPVVAPATRQEATKHLAAGNKALGMRQLDTAITEYEAAVAAWPDAHLAWYGLGAARAMKPDWPAALTGFENALQRRPDSAMYQMWTGIAQYE